MGRLSINRVKARKSNPKCVDCLGEARMNKRPLSTVKVLDPQDNFGYMDDIEQNFVHLCHRHFMELALDGQDIC